MAAQYGTVVYVTSQGNLIKDIYFDDTANNLVRWDSGNGAGAASPTEFVAPVDGMISDIVLAAATGQTKTQVSVNNQPTGTILRNAIHLASITTRPAVNIPVRGGSKVTMTQLA